MKSVLVIGTGTIGEPLIGLLSRMRQEIGIRNVFFHKRTPLKEEYAKVESLISQDANLVVDSDCQEAFLALGHKPSAVYEDALALCDVIIDCTPAGNIAKEKHYLPLSLRSEKKKVFIAQGSEKGFGVPYGYMLNDEILSEQPDYIQVVSCNTHAIARLCSVLGKNNNFISGDFVCIRRANDPSQDSGFVASPTVGKHDDDEFGTHHARDVYDLLKTTCGEKYLNLTSSALKTNTQYMHSIRFAITLERTLTLEEVISMMHHDKMIALTHHKSSNRVFSFGRDHGFYGRIYNQVVINQPSIAVFHEGKRTKVMGFAFTPQDGNSLLSSVAAAAAAVLPNRSSEQLFEPLDKLLRNYI